jgi:solute carrier family 25 protein 34/35
VAKTRLQLQGELAQGGGQKVYNNVFDVFKKIWRNEGIRGVQRGLPPAVRLSCAQTQVKSPG